MRSIFLFTFFLFTGYVSAQDYTLLGKLVEDTTGKPLESATVYAEAIKDSTLLGYTITNRKGEFALDIQTKDRKVNVFISFTGLQSIQKTISLDKPTVSLGALFMQEQPQSLDEVVVVAERAPITIKKDTLEFNVTSFKTKQNATVEDLLKKLPGVDVDENGKITVNGKEVSQVLVNGKPFFGNDPTIATKNLPKDIVDKIQVVDTKTKSEEFIGKKGDQKTKTINITIDEEKNKGTFGRVTAGAGTDNRYKVSGIVNYFNKDLRVSVLGGKNNVNTPGFSFNEIREMIGGGRSISWSSNGSFSIDGRSFGGQRGITTASTIGGYFTKDLTEKNSLAVDYFNSNSSSVDKSTTRRENYIPDNNYILNQIQDYKSDATSNAINLNFETEIDSTLKIIIKPSFSFVDGTLATKNQSSSETFDNDLINDSEASSYRKSRNHRFFNATEIVKKFGSRGSYIELSVENEFTKSNAEDFQLSDNTIYDNFPETISRNQRIEETNGTQYVNANFTYSYPIIKDSLSLNFAYQIRQDKNKIKTNTQDFNDLTQDYTNFNSVQSADFIFKNFRQAPGIGFDYTGKKFSLNVEAGIVFRTLQLRDYLHSISLKRNYKNLDFSSWGNYKFSNTASVYFNYYIDNRPPQPSQLQPFTDTSDPLRIITGNPNLKPTQDHTFYAGYNAFDFKSKSGMFLYLNASYNKNQIVSKTTIDHNLVRNSTYANVTGGYRVGIGGTYRKTVIKDSLFTLKIKPGVWGNANKNINFTNGIKYSSNTLSVTPRFGATFNFAEKVEIEPSYNISFSNTEYSLDSFENQKFTTQRLRLKTATFIPKKVEWRNDVSFVYNPNVAQGFNKQYVIWNMSLGIKVFKDNGLFQAQVFDLLKQRTNDRRISSQDFIEDTQSTVLQQYFMFSFTYNLKKVGGKKSMDGGIVIFD